MKKEVDKVYYVPLLDSLRKLLEMDLVQESVSFFKYMYIYSALTYPKLLYVHV